jgi:signal transduction histidine kinase
MRPRVKPAYAAAMRIERFQALRRPVDARVVDATLVAFGVGLTALAIKTPWSPLPTGVIAVAGLAGSLAVWWHRRRPEAVTVIGAVAHVLSGNPWPLAVGLFSGAATRPRWRLPVLAIVGTIGLAGLNWVEARAVGFEGVGDSALLAMAVLAIGTYAGTRQELLDSLRDRAHRAEAERHLRAEHARAAERTRIAREMHDVLAHKLSLIALHAGALEVDPATDPVKVEQAATLVGSTAREALDELRWVLGLLRPDGEVPVGSVPTDDFADLRRLVTSWARAGVSVELRDEVGQMPPAIERAAYRLVQEGLTNAHKHAPGAAVAVTVAGGRGDDVVVSVVNGAPDGTDHADLTGAGTGLVGLGERLRLVGGTLSSGRHGADGWKLEGRFPWSDDGPGIRQHDAADGSTP